MGAEESAAMSNKDRPEPQSDEQPAVAPSIRSPAVPIGAPPRRNCPGTPALLAADFARSLTPPRKSLSLAPPRRPGDAPPSADSQAGAALVPTPPSRISQLSIPRFDPRAEESDAPTPVVDSVAPRPSSAPSPRPTQPPPGPPPSSRELRPSAPPFAENPFAEKPFAEPVRSVTPPSKPASQYARSATPTPRKPSLADDIFSLPPPPPLPDRFDLDELFSGAPKPTAAPVIRAPAVAPRKPTAAPKSLARVAPAAGNSTYASLPPLRNSATLTEGASPPRSIGSAMDGESETALQGSERALAAHACMLTLARASRSYLIYDPSNQAVRGFLDALRNSFADYLARYGELPLTVRPFELVLDQEVVYIERERERSLALKLFRDGVRKITLDADTTWQELTKLLEILSIRFVGVRHDEDDLVTLLWKAGFHHINIESIEGFVPDDDDEQPAGAQGPAASVVIIASAKIPVDFDLPAPELPKPVHPSPVAVSDDVRAALVAECASPQLPQVTIDLIRQLLAVASDPTNPLGFDEIAPLLREARDFLLSDSRLQQLLTLFDVIVKFTDQHADLAEALGPLVASFFDARAIQKLVHSVPNDAPAAPPELKALLTSLPYDPVPMLLELLGTERAESDRRILRELLEGFLPERADVVIARLREVRGSLAADLLRILSERLPDAPALVASTLISGNDDELQMEFLRLTASARTDASTRGVLVHLLRSPSELLRVRTIEAIGEHREPGAFTLLLRHAEHRAEERSSAEEMVAVGRAMTLVDAARAMEAFREWGKPAGLMRRLIKNDAHGARVRAAAAGLVRQPTEEADTLLREMSAGVRTEAMRKVVEDARAERAHAKGSRS